MKYFIIALILICFIQTPYAQGKINPDNNLMMDNLKTVKTPFVKDIFPKAIILYNSDIGKIYALPLDYMKCLVPGLLFTFEEEEYYKQ